MPQFEHTKTPWGIEEANGHILVGPTDGKKVIDTVTFFHIKNLTAHARVRHRANAAFIVQCVNAHDELVEALEAAKKRMRNCRGAIESNQVEDKDVHGSLGRGMRDIDAALEKAGRTI